MPTKREREYYAMGFADGIKLGRSRAYEGQYTMEDPEFVGRYQAEVSQTRRRSTTRPKRKLSAWNKYVKANSKKPRFRYRNGKLNLKKMAVAFRKTRKRGGKR
jgi:hypothetical protein